MTKWKCSICGWVYDAKIGFPEKSIDPGTDFTDLPDNFRCPECGAMKKWFLEMKD